MLILGHVGIGSRLGALIPRVRAAHAPGWLILGTLLPDLIDKPLYYGLKLSTGRTGSALGLISCTRTIGHSALFALLVALGFWAAGRRAAGLALLAGQATHWLLDIGGDVTGFLSHRLGWTPEPTGFSAVRALLFPLLGRHFSVLPFHTAREHLMSLAHTYTLLGEVTGAALLFAAWRKAHAAPEVDAAGTEAPRNVI